MLYVVEGRSEKRLKRVWRWFGKERAAEITHAVIDMYRPFANSIRAHCRKEIRQPMGDTIAVGVRVGQIIFDKFHVMRHLNNALNEVRKAELRGALGRFLGPRSKLRRRDGARRRHHLLGRLGWPRGFPKNKPARAPPLPLGGEAEGCQPEGFKDDGRQSWPSGSGVDWPA